MAQRLEVLARCVAVIERELEQLGAKPIQAVQRVAKAHRRGVESYDILAGTRIE